jgi:hypothetical protein
LAWFVLLRQWFGNNSVKGRSWMKLVTDTGSYLEQQEIFTSEMIARIVSYLEEAGLEGDVLKDVAGEVAFGITCMIDGVSEVSFEGNEVHPYLTFQNSDGELIHESFASISMAQLREY